jgi:hypothetical protein
VYAVLWAGVAVLALLTIGNLAGVGGIAVAQFVLAVVVMLMHVACAVLNSRVRKRVSQAATCLSDRSCRQAAVAAAMLPTEDGGAGGVVYGLRYSPEGRITSIEVHEVL